MTRKIVTNSALGVVFAGLAVAGVLAVVKGNDYTNNAVNFDIEYNYAYCNIEGNYYEGRIDQENGSVIYWEAADPYSASYKYEDEYSSKSDLENTFKKWNIGESTFMFDPNDDSNNIDVLKYVITIENLNPDRPLEVGISGVAVDEESSYDASGHKVVNNKCYTSIEYSIDEGETVVAFNNDVDNQAGYSLYRSGETTVEVEDLATIPVGSKLTVEIKFTRTQKSKSIYLVNNFSFTISGVA